jgi:hypothetical protein
VNEYNERKKVLLLKEQDDFPVDSLQQPKTEYYIICDFKNFFILNKDRQSYNCFFYQFEDKPKISEYLNSKSIRIKRWEQIPIDKNQKKISSMLFLRRFLGKSEINHFSYNMLLKHLLKEIRQQEMIERNFFRRKNFIK